MKSSKVIISGKAAMRGHFGKLMKIIDSLPSDLIQRQRHMHEAEIVASDVAAHQDSNQQDSPPRLSERGGVIHFLGRQNRSQHAEAECSVSHGQQYGKSESAETQRPSIGQVEDRVECQVQREEGNVEGCAAPVAPRQRVSRHFRRARARAHARLGKQRRARWALPSLCPASLQDRKLSLEDIHSDLNHHAGSQSLRDLAALAPTRSLGPPDSSDAVPQSTEIMIQSASKS